MRFRSLHLFVLVTVPTPNRSPFTSPFRSTPHIRLVLTHHNANSFPIFPRLTTLGADTTPKTNEPFNALLVLLRQAAGLPSGRFMEESQGRMPRPNRLHFARGPRGCHPAPRHITDPAEELTPIQQKMPAFVYQFSRQSSSIGEDLREGRYGLHVFSNQH